MVHLSLGGSSRGKRASEPDVRADVDALLRDAVARRASDVHLEPTAKGCDVRFRIDGLLHTVHVVDIDSGRSLIVRLMVMAQLLTYRQDVPQEGRFAVLTSEGQAIDLRLAIMPTTHGLRAAVRLPVELSSPGALASLSLPARVVEGLLGFAEMDTGMLLLTGPAGSGKTTTIYGLLEYIREKFDGLSIVTLEDPVERDLPGVTQIEVRPFGELTYERALRSMLRQDPQVLMLGEIRDAATAAVAVQAALSGHRLIATLHAGSPATAICRLLEMGLEPYQVAGSVYGIVSQRLVRRLNDDGDLSGRLPVAEFARVDESLRKAIIARSDTASLTDIVAMQPGYQTLRQESATLIEAGRTTEEEVRRVLGHHVQSE